MADVKPGQVYADLDAREKGRTVTVLALTTSGEYAFCKASSSGKRVRIHLSRLVSVNGSRPRFRLVEELASDG